MYNTITYRFGVLRLYGCKTFENFVKELRKPALGKMAFIKSGFYNHCTKVFAQDLSLTLTIESNLYVLCVFLQIYIRIFGWQQPHVHNRDEFVGRNDNINLQKTCFTRSNLPPEKGPFQESFEMCTNLVGTVVDDTPYSLYVLNIYLSYV